MLAPLGSVLAQTPVITAVTPMANATAVARTSPITVSFSQSIPAAAAGALKVFSAQRGGQRARGATPAVVNENNLLFTPTAYPFMPGETVYYTVSPVVINSNGALTKPRVGQFTTTVGGDGRGVFQKDYALDVTDPQDAATGDVDGDGDLDLLVAKTKGVSIYLNDGSSHFGNPRDVAVGNANSWVSTIVLGDVDGDGDLDFVCSNSAFMADDNSVSVCLNDGSGNFNSGQNAAAPSFPGRMALGDLDSDGDLDLVIAPIGTSYSNPSLLPSSIAVSLNDGTGKFAYGSTVQVGRLAETVVIGDVDNDGDLDLLTENSASSTVSVCLNNGAGVFSTSQTVATGSSPADMALGDVDGDGDLDFATANFNRTDGVSVRLNDGKGTFTGSQEVATSTFPKKILLRDIDSDGDLDLLAISDNLSTSRLSVCLNDGGGLFSSIRETSLEPAYTILSGDTDGDGDLDLLVVNSKINNKANIDVLLNRVAILATTPVSATTGLSLFPNPARVTTTLTGVTPGAYLTVLDALGRVVLTATADVAGTAHLNLSPSLSAGVYVIRSGEQVRRLVIE